MKKLLLVLAVLLFSAPATFAASDNYVDDSSNATAVIRSLYNAINRKEYARAYSYFSTPPADSLDEFAAGYADTKSVDLLTGTATAEGAAGSTYYALPVAIEATMTDGSTLVFAGCYTLRLAQPQVQGVPYQPLRIEKGALKPGKAPLADAIAQTCSAQQPDASAGDSEKAAGQTGDEPGSTGADPLLDKAKAQFSAIYADVCDPRDASAGDDAAKPESYPIAFNYPTDDQDQPKRTAELFRFLVHQRSLQ